MTTESHQAELLARWLSESPPGAIRSAPPSGLDADVVDAISALRPDCAPTPRVGIDDILLEVADGPLAEAVDPAAAGALGALLEGASSPHELDPDVLDAVSVLQPARAPAPRVSIDDILAAVEAGPLARAHTTDAPDGTVPTGDGSHAHRSGAPPAARRRLPTWVWPSLGGIAMAATALLFVAPVAQQAMDAPPAGSVASEPEAQQTPRTLTTTPEAPSGNGSAAEGSATPVAVVASAEAGDGQDGAESPASSPAPGADDPTTGSGTGAVRLGTRGGAADGRARSQDTRFSEALSPIGAAPPERMAAAAPSDRWRPEESAADAAPPPPGPEPRARPSTQPRAAEDTTAGGAREYGVGALDAAPATEATGRTRKRTRARRPRRTLEGEVLEAERTRSAAASVPAPGPRSDSASGADESAAAADLASLRAAAWPLQAAPSTRSADPDGWSTADRARKDGDADALARALDALLQGPDDSVAQEAAWELARHHLRSGLRDRALDAIAQGLERAGGHRIARAR
ncbi:MAG: hypothetical protein VX000_08735, partial [Myxococcota bacterium]|nr:hypothetical protein [Myxococcota bacterium]